MLLKHIEDVKEPLFMWVISTGQPYGDQILYIFASVVSVTIFTLLSQNLPIIDAQIIC